MSTLVLIHTVPPLVEAFDVLCRRLLPGVAVKHILDEPLLEAVRRRGGLAAGDLTRFQSHVSAAESVAARAVLVTCSTISPMVDQVQAQIPVLKIDAAMIAAAVQHGGHIRVLATNPTTLEPTRLMLESEAERQGKPLNVTLTLVENAFSALLAGDATAHDDLLRSAILKMAPGVDVVVLAQASMARVMDSLPGPHCLVLSSPHLALAQIQNLLREV
jgi:hypothetical protein